MIMENANQNKALVGRFYDQVYVHWRMEVADELLSPRFISHDWPPALGSGPEAFRAYYTMFLKAVPDARYEVEDLIAGGDRVVVRWQMQATYQDAFPGIELPPMDQSITLKGVAIYRIEAGKLAERWVVSDLYGLLKEAQPAVAG